MNENFSFGSELKVSNIGQNIGTYNEHHELNHFVSNGVQFAISIELLTYTRANCLILWLLLCTRKGLLLWHLKRSFWMECCSQVKNRVESCLPEDTKWILAKVCRKMRTILSNTCYSNAANFKAMNDSFEFYWWIYFSYRSYKTATSKYIIELRKFYRRIFKNKGI